MPRGRKKAVGPTNHEILNAALAGLELQKSKIDAQIAHVRGLLGKRGPGRPPASAAPAAAAAAGAKPKRRTLSAAARKRIAAAQKKRWAEFRKKMGGGKEGA